MTLMTTAERRKALGHVEDVDPDLALLLEQELAMDPTVRVLVQGLDGLRIQSAADSAATRHEVLSELRATRWQMIAIVTLAMVIQAGLIGLSVSLDAAGTSLQVTPTALMISTPTPSGDDAAFLDTGPWSARVLP